MRIDAVTARYTEALFGLALARGEMTAVQADIDRVEVELRDPAVAAYLFDARVEQDQRRAQLQPLMAAFCELTRNFVNLLFDKRREDVLRHLPAAWRQRSLDERGAVEGVVESARALDTGDLEALRAALSSRLGKEVLLENRVVPDLMAGVRVFVDNRMFDGTALGRLEGLRRKMLEAPLTAALGSA